jgi:hypothetical protein
MIGSLQSLKQLEALVKEAVEALRSATTENVALKRKLAALESDYKRTKEQLREANITLARHARLKARLTKLSEKLERIG